MAGGPSVRTTKQKRKVTSPTAARWTDQSPVAKETKGEDRVIVPSVLTWTVDEDQAGQRIDNYLLARLKGVPKTRIYKMLRTGEVRVNGGRVANDYRLEPEDRLRIPPVRVAAGGSTLRAEGVANT